jgi:hypothetical protein
MNLLSCLPVSPITTLSAMANAYAIPTNAIIVFHAKFGRIAEFASERQSSSARETPPSCEALAITMMAGFWSTRAFDQAGKSTLRVETGCWIDLVELWSYNDSANCGRREVQCGSVVRHVQLSARLPYSFVGDIQGAIGVLAPRNEGRIRKTGVLCEQRCGARYRVDLVDAITNIHPIFTKDLAVMSLIRTPSTVH